MQLHAEETCLVVIQFNQYEPGGSSSQIDTKWI